MATIDSIVGAYQQDTSNELASSLPLPDTKQPYVGTVAVASEWLPQCQPGEQNTSYRSSTCSEEISVRSTMTTRPNNNYTLPFPSALPSSFGHSETPLPEITEPEISSSDEVMKRENRDPEWHPSCYNSHDHPPENFTADKVSRDSYPSSTIANGQYEYWESQQQDKEVQAFPG
ncbi:hypothetical protein V5O48_016071 [Marasmius crinis-equi]|uniref:Uncharacterized protein n=1 Tax=Marasmius crinis-equi TaxID=585013 RepID=A0ABR3ESR2_9AGAR